MTLVIKIISYDIRTNIVLSTRGWGSKCLIWFGNGNLTPFNILSTYGTLVALKCSPPGSRSSNVLSTYYELNAC
jgi:hypothetical protein